MKPAHCHTTLTWMIQQSFRLSAVVALTLAVIACTGDSADVATIVTPAGARQATASPLPPATTQLGVTSTAASHDHGSGPDPTAGAPPSTHVNPCAFPAPEQTPAPVLRAPQSAPFGNAAPVVQSTPERPSAEVLEYPDLPPPALPAPVKSWQDAVVGVTVELTSGRILNQQGLVVDDGVVLTVLDLLEEVASLTVKVSGRGAFSAELERFDLRTGAALLTTKAEGLVVAPDEHATVSHGEPVLLLGRDHDTGELVVEDTFASPSINAPDDIFALRGDYTPGVQFGLGFVVITADGAPVGLAGDLRNWYGYQVVLGTLGSIDLPAVLLDSALRLVESVPPNGNITPAAVTYYGLAVRRHVDGPVTRALLAEPVQGALADLGEQVPLVPMGGRGLEYWLGYDSGTILELLYATLQELRGTDGELLGRARYIALWWDREGGAPDLVLCGTGTKHLGAAFATHGLGSFERLMEEAPSSYPHSMVAAAPLDAPEYGYIRKYGYSSEDYQYPYEWELKTDKSAYVSGEPVALTFTVTNTSEWPVPLDYVPPRVTIYGEHELRVVAVLGYGDERRVLSPDETVSYTMTWDQMHFEGGRAPPGRYIARVQLANLVTNRWLDWGPVTYEIILE